MRRPLKSTLFPYTTLFRSNAFENFADAVKSALLPLGQSLLSVLLPAVEKATSIIEYLRSEEHTSELQSLRHLVCRLLLEKKKINLTVHTKKLANTARIRAH